MVRAMMIPWLTTDPSWRTYRGTARWCAGNRDDEVALEELILGISKFTLMMMTVLFDTSPMLINIGLDIRPRHSPTRESAEWEASDASTLECCAWPLMESGTVHVMIYVIISMGSYGDSSHNDADVGRWPC